MCTYATTPLSFGQLIKNCFASYGAVFKKTWPMILVAAFLIFIRTLVQAPPEVLWLMNLVLFLILVFVNAMIFHEAHHALAAHAVPAHDSYVATKKKYFAFLACFFVIYILSVLLVFSVLFAIIGTLGIDANTLAYYLGSVPPSIPAWIGWLSIALGIFFFILLFFLYFGPALVITKDLSAGTALKESVALVKGHWWRVLLALAIVYLVIAVVFYFVDVIYPVEDAVIGAVRTFIFQLLIYPLTVGTTLTILNDLRLRHR